jgi:hypothetical protein
MTRRVFTVLAQILLFLATSNAQTTPTQKPAHPQKPAQPKTEPHAFWTPALEENYGVTEKSFQDMGLGRLTQEQEVSLIMWASERESQAKAAVVAPIFDCGRPGDPILGAKAEDYEKVRLYISASGSAEEIISGIRQRLRGDERHRGRVHL